MTLNCALQMSNFASITFIVGTFKALLAQIGYCLQDRYDTRCYFNVHSKADMSQLNLMHGNDN